MTAAFFTGILFIIFSHPVSIFAASNLNGHTVGIESVDMQVSSVTDEVFGPPKPENYPSQNQVNSHSE